jgi:hypothetical protein
MNGGNLIPEHRMMLHDAAVCCRLCDPPQRVDIPARIFYRLKDVDSVACANGHQGTLLEYKQAASQLATPHGPFIRYGQHSADWLAAGAPKSGV